MENGTGKGGGWGFGRAPSFNSSVGAHNNDGGSSYDKYRKHSVRIKARQSNSLTANRKQTTGDPSKVYNFAQDKGNSATDKEKDAGADESQQSCNTSAHLRLGRLIERFNSRGRVEGQPPYEY